MKRAVIKPSPGSSLAVRAQVIGSVPRHRPVKEPVPPGLASLNRSNAAVSRSLSYNTKSSPKLVEDFVHRGNVILRTTERPNGAETSQRKKPNEKAPESEKPGKADSFHFMMRLPFLYSITLAQTESHYLKQRNRSSWWTRGPFPKIPKDSVNDVMRDTSLEPVELLVKMLPLAVVFFSATFNLCILQNVKDTIMITQVGAETLPFLAGFGVLPASVMFFSFYNKLVNALPVKTVFYAAVAPLLACYAMFALFLYPAAPYLHPHGFIEAFSSYVPVGFTGLLQCIENWTFSVFFCIAELWGAVVISVLFWSLANDVCTVNEAKTIYPLMGISANIALVIAGTFIKNLPVLAPLTSLRVLIGSVLVMSLVMFAGKYYLDKNILPKVEEEHALKNLGKPKKTKGTFKEGFAVLRESPKILNLALLVIGCSISHRLFDVAWKGQLKLVYPTALAYQSVLADVSVWTGMSTIAAMIGGKFAFQYLGWGFAAATTPIVMLVTGCVFFAISIMYNSGSASLGLAVVGAMAGNITQVVCKAAKYSLFDPAKEMVYIEMSKEEKSKGKAAVDLVSNQVGKTGASWMSQALLLTFGSIPASMPCIATLYTGVIIMWTAAVFKLQNQLKKTEEERMKETQLSIGGEVDLVPSINGAGPHLPKNGNMLRKLTNRKHGNSPKDINLESPTNAIIQPSG